jgi:hypothetical protein
MSAAAPLSTNTVPGVGTVPPPWSTPKKLRAYRLVLWVVATLLLLHAAATLAESRRTVKTIGKDTVPSIIAAEEIGYALADLDANVANSLLGNAQHRQAATAQIEKQRYTVTDSLVDAAQNITYGDAEKIPIRSMMRDLGLYLERAAEARFRFEQGDAAGARLSYWQATDLLHTKLLPAASDLDAANKIELDAAYWRGVKETQGEEVIACFLGLVVVVALFGLQSFLFKRMRRILNGPLVAATVVAVLLPGFLAYRYTTARSSLRLAKEDAFDSIHSLVRARALAFDANGDESRFLLDTGNTRGFDVSFRSKVQSLSTSGTKSPPSKSDLAKRKQHATSGRKDPDTGLFWDELDNVTFPGEYDAAARMVAGFRDYLTIDARIRKLAAQGKQDDAVELCIGTRPDESNAAFDSFDAALGSTVDINRAAFDREINTTSQALATAEVTTLLLWGLLVGLVWLGLRPRLAEYTA